MSRQASVNLLARTPLGRLACCNEGQPYITPIYFARHENYLYSLSTLGQKIVWMRENPLVCVEFDEVASPHDWTAVIVLGTYEELRDTPQYAVERKRAYALLQRRPMWWEPAAVKISPDEKTDLEHVYFRIHIDRISGHRGVPDTASGEISVTGKSPASRPRKMLWRPWHQQG